MDLNTLKNISPEVYQSLNNDIRKIDFDLEIELDDTESRDMRGNRIGKIVSKRFLYS